MGDNGHRRELNGRKAMRALHAYIEWVNGSLNGVWDSTEELERANADVRERVRDVTVCIESGKPLKVYVL